MKKIAIYDTTLRDGCQGVDINFSLEDKIDIAKELDAMRIDYIEGGFPFSNPKDNAFFTRAASMHWEHARIASFGSTRKPDARAEDDAQIRSILDTQTPVTTIVGKSWTAHVLEVLRTTLDENLRMIEDSVRFLKSEGREVIFDAEHFFEGFLNDPDYAVKVLRVASDAGADVVVVCDTNGGMLSHMVQEILAQVPSDALSVLGGHFHNDAGTAEANSIEAVFAGARHIQGTINGWGERCGNADLCTLIPSFTLKTEFQPASGKYLNKLTSLSRFAAEKANIIHNKRLPYVGEAAFSHKAGQHADVIIKSAHRMEHIDASIVGNERHVILSELAGKSTIIARLEQYGNFDKQSPEVNELIELLVQKESEGFSYEAAEASFELLIMKTLKTYTPLHQLRNYHIELFKTAESDSTTVARMYLNVENHEVMGAGVGIGPVETLDKTIRHALVPQYPFLEKIALTDYRVRVIDGEHSTQAKVRVFITASDHKQSWNTIGVHQNVVEASYMALMDSYNYYFNVYKKDL